MQILRSARRKVPILQEEGHGEEDQGLPCFLRDQGGAVFAMMRDSRLIGPPCGFCEMVLDCTLLTARDLKVFTTHLRVYHHMKEYHMEP